MILLFSMIIELMAKRESSGIRLALNKPFMYTAVLDLIHQVLQKSFPLSFVTQRDVKLFVF